MEISRLATANVRSIDIQLVPIGPEGHQPWTEEVPGLIFTATVVGFTRAGEKFTFETQLTRAERAAVLDVIERVKRRLLA
jgi:hypothetical protein